MWMYKTRVTIMTATRDLTSMAKHLPHQYKLGAVATPNQQTHEQQLAAQQQAAADAAFAQQKQAYTEALKSGFVQYKANANW